MEWIPPCNSRTYLLPNRDHEARHDDPLKSGFFNVKQLIGRWVEPASRHKCRHNSRLIVITLSFLLPWLYHALCRASGECETLGEVICRRFLITMMSKLLIEDRIDWLRVFNMDETSFTPKSTISPSLPLKDLGTCGGRRPSPTSTCLYWRLLVHLVLRSLPHHPSWFACSRQSSQRSQLTARASQVRLREIWMQVSSRTGWRSSLPCWKPRVPMVSHFGLE